MSLIFYTGLSFIGMGLAGLLLDLLIEEKENEQD